jgi:hypothetical protein
MVGCFIRDKDGRSLKLTAHHLLVLRLRIGELYLAVCICLHVRQFSVQELNAMPSVSNLCTSFSQLI